MTEQELKKMCCQSYEYRKLRQENERLKKLAEKRWDNYIDATIRLSDLNDENVLLKEKLEVCRNIISDFAAKFSELFKDRIKGS